jgi:hypothetical protein
MLTKSKNPYTEKRGLNRKCMYRITESEYNAFLILSTFIADFKIIHLLNGRKNGKNQ